MQATNHAMPAPWRGRDDHPFPSADTASVIGAERRLLAQISLAHWVSHVHIMVVPALLPLLPGHFGRSFLEIGAALTVFNLVSLVVQGPMGLVCDRFGHRRVLTAGLVWAARASCCWRRCRPIRC